MLSKEPLLTFELLLREIQEVSKAIQAIAITLGHLPEAEVTLLLLIPHTWDSKELSWTDLEASSLRTRPHSV